MINSLAPELSSQFTPQRLEIWLCLFVVMTLVDMQFSQHHTVCWL